MELLPTFEEFINPNEPIPPGKPTYQEFIDNYQAYVMRDPISGQTWRIVGYYKVENKMSLKYFSGPSGTVGPDMEKSTEDVWKDAMLIR